MICNNCNKEFPESDFCSNGVKRKDGTCKKRRICKQCSRQQNKDWRATHKDHYIHYNKVTRKERKPTTQLPADDKAIPQHVIVPPAV